MNAPKMNRIALVVANLGDVAVWNTIFQPETQKADGFFRKTRQGMDPQWARIEAAAYGTPEASIPTGEKNEDGTDKMTALPLGVWDESGKPVFLPQTDFHGFKNSGKDRWLELKGLAFVAAIKVMPGYQNSWVNEAIHNFSRAIRGHVQMGADGKPVTVKSTPGVLPGRLNAAKETDAAVTKQLADAAAAKEALELQIKQQADQFEQMKQMMAQQAAQIQALLDSKKTEPEAPKESALAEAGSLEQVETNRNGNKHNRR
jgi:hypothetical protein